MYGPMDAGVMRQRREELLREARLIRLERALRAKREVPAAPRWLSAAAWELARIAGRVRKSFRAPKSAD